ncbi:MAG: class I SAM-dependent methyltransferase [Lentisphaerae bacterium]|nr:class I SAM-dependent methyltransferase [Lentisphaerota bacterium]
MSGRLAYRAAALLARLVWFVPKPVLARVVARMAESGEGSEQCLAWGCLPLQVHFYSPVPDIGDLKKRRVWDRRSELPGIDFRPGAQMELLQELGEKFGAECDWPARAVDGGGFYTENAAFSFGCAASTHCMIRKCKPERVIEVGSGWSTMIIAAALDRNASETGTRAQHVVVDPYPSDRTLALPGVTVLRQRVELTDESLFGALGKNDILFIDSGHTVRMGGDVNFLYLDVLPRLAAGVVVHAHDIPMPYEYAESYVTNPRFRVFWTESYLLQAFLACNCDFEVLLAMNYLQREHEELFRQAFHRYDSASHRQVAASFWMRRSGVRPIPAREPTKVEA